MLQRLRKHRSISTGLALAGTLGAASAAVDRPRGIGAIDSVLAQYMHLLGLAQAYVILAGGRLPRIHYHKMTMILEEVRLP
jgi:hypothetical protein